MSNLIIREHNTETNEVIDREMTDIEATNYATMVAVIESSNALALAKKETKTALLGRLGITEEEARLLLGGN